MTMIVGNGVAGPKAWIQAARIPTLPAAVVPVLVGTALALGRHYFRLVPFVMTLLASLLIQIGTNLANDYFDFKKGADTETRLGPTRITSAGVVSPARVLQAAGLTFGLAGMAGIYLSFVGGWPILVIGVASILAGVLYTAGPAPLGYHGLGDVICFAFFGMVAVVGTYYLQTRSVIPAAFVAATPVACLVTAILVVNNVRDIETDRAAGKMTLAARLGRRATRMEYTLLMVGAYLCPIVMAVLGMVSWWSFWLPLITLPLCISLVKIVSTRVDGPSLNGALAGTGRLHLAYGVLFAITLLT